MASFILWSCCVAIYQLNSVSNYSSLSIVCKTYLLEIVGNSDMLVTNALLGLGVMHMGCNLITDL